MVGLIDKLSEPGNRLWLDYTDYAARLLAQDRVPWTAIDRAIAWLRQAHGLLRPDVLPIPVAAVVKAWLEANPALIAAMAGRSRTLFPLKTLLGDPGLRAHLHGLFEAAGASLSAYPIVAVIPSPRAWISIAYGQAFPGVTIDIEDDAMDSAASYIADLLRALPQTTVAGILLDETPEAAAFSRQSLGLYQAVFNIASHYRWPVGLYVPRQDITELVDEAARSIPDFWILSNPVPGKRCGAIVPPAFWDGGEIPHDGAFFRFARIPQDAEPEAVLDRLAALQ